MGHPLQGLGCCRAGALIWLAGRVRPSNLVGDELEKGTCLTQGLGFPLPCLQGPQGTPQRSLSFPPP